MTALDILLVAGGAILLALGLLRIRGPLSRMRQLDATQANLDRYEAWRGRSSDVEADGPTGADEMRSLLRRQVLSWGVVCVIGAVAIVSGLLLR